MYPKCSGDSVLHVYAKLCQLPSVDSRSCLEAYQRTRKEAIKMLYQKIRPNNHHRLHSNQVGFFKLRVSFTFISGTTIRIY